MKMAAAPAFRVVLSAVHGSEEPRDHVFSKPVFAVYYFVNAHFVVNAHFAVSSHFAVNAHFVASSHFVANAHFVVNAHFVASLHFAVNAHTGAPALPATNFATHFRAPECVFVLSHAPVFRAAHDVAQQNPVLHRYTVWPARQIVRQMDRQIYAQVYPAYPDALIPAVDPGL